MSHTHLGAKKGPELVGVPALQKSVFAGGTWVGGAAREREERVGGPAELGVLSGRIAKSENRFPLFARCSLVVGALSVFGDVEPVDFGLFADPEANKCLDDETGDQRTDSGPGNRDDDREDLDAELRAERG